MSKKNKYNIRENIDVEASNIFEVVSNDSINVEEDVEDIIETENKIEDIVSTPVEEEKTIIVEEIVKPVPVKKTRSRRIIY